MRSVQMLSLLFSLSVSIPLLGQANSPPPAPVPQEPAPSPAPPPSNSRGGPRDGEAFVEREADPVSPARRVERPRPTQGAIFLGGPVRSIDGSGNHLDAPDVGAAVTPLRRWLAAAYGDGVSSLAGADRASPRLVSNTVCFQEGDNENPLGASDFLWQWGQFVDHDIDLTDGTIPPESAAITVPTGDPYFDPDGTGAATIAFNRSLYDVNTGTGLENPRQQINEISSWIDASNVYGSDAERAAALRTQDGTGRLKTSDGNLLPFNMAGLPNAGGDSAALFLAGDVRANEQVGLTALHTLFVREHNRLAEQIAEQVPALDGDQIYERARALVAAEMQVITYREYLPALLGRGALAPYDGYDPTVDASITNLFSSACYRYGHSALSSTLLRLDANGAEIAEGSLPLRDAFFTPSRIIDEGGIEPLLRGLAAQSCQAVDPYVIDDIRNFLFGPPGAGGFDLASLNIQRGRDHGLPDYNTAREALGLGRVESFAEISSDVEIQTRLANAYASVDDIDLWVGALSEDPVPGAHVGELNAHVLKAQFEALRDGDRFWYQHALSGEDLRRLESTRLSDVIRRNTPIGGELPDDVFHVRDGPAGTPTAGDGPRREPLRGDVNADGSVDLADPIAALRFLFLGAEPPRSPGAADMNGDGTLDIVDAIALLEWLFGETNER